MKQEYIDLYLAKAEEHGFEPGDIATKEGQQNIARYLLVNGHIPFTAENVALVGDQEFYMSGLPEALRKKIKDLVLASEADREHWTFDDELELEHQRLVKTEVEGAWIRNGEIDEAKIVETRIVKVQTTYHVPVKHKIEE